MTPAILMSIRPRFANAILAGEKSHELRRRFVAGGPGTRVFVYSSSPICKVIGAFEIGTVDRLPRWLLASRKRRATTLTASEIRDYLEGLRHGTLIGVHAPVRLAEPVPLAELRGWGLEPPQSYRYLTSEQVKLIEREPAFEPSFSRPSTRPIRRALASGA